MKSIPLHRLSGGSLPLPHQMTESAGHADPHQWQSFLFRNENQMAGPTSSDVSVACSWSTDDDMRHSSCPSSMCSSSSEPVGANRNLSPHVPWHNDGQQLQNPQRGSPTNIRRSVSPEDRAAGGVVSIMVNDAEDMDEADQNRTSLLQKIRSINKLAQEPTSSQPCGPAASNKYACKAITEERDDKKAGHVFFAGSIMGSEEVSMRNGSTNSPMQTQENPVQEQQKAVFVDASQMKQKVRDAIHSPKWDVTTLYHDKGMCQWIARLIFFENLTLFIIALNAAWIWVEADYNEKDVLTEAPWYFQVGSNLFCGFFSFEWIVRFMAFRRKVDARKDTWFIFDTLLCFLMVLETWVTPLIIIFSSGTVTPGQGLAGMTVMRIMKILRLTRMARMVRLLRAMPELRILVKGMSAAMRSVAFTLFLLFALIYVYALCFRQLTMEPDNEIGQMYFSSIPESMLTLLVYGALLDEISQLLFDLKDQDAYVLVVIMLSFIVLAGVTVMNMLVGVLCEVVNAVAAVEKEELLVGSVHAKLMQIVQASLRVEDRIVNNDGEYVLTRNEFDKILGIPQAVRALQEVGVDVVGLVDYTDLIFADDHHLSFRDFMEVVLQLRGTNTATVKDVVDLRKALTFYMDNNTKLMSSRLEKSLMKALKTKRTTTEIKPHGDNLGRKGKRTHTAPAAKNARGSARASAVADDSTGNKVKFEVQEEDGTTASPAFQESKRKIKGSFFMRGISMKQVRSKSSSSVLETEREGDSSDEQTDDEIEALEVRDDPPLQAGIKGSVSAPEMRPPSQEMIGDAIFKMQSPPEAVIEKPEASREGAEPPEEQRAPSDFKRQAESADAEDSGMCDLATLADRAVIQAIDQRFLQFETMVRNALRPLLGVVIAEPEESAGETGGTLPQPSRDLGAVHQIGVGEINAKGNQRTDDPERHEHLWRRVFRLEEDLRATFFELHELHRANFAAGRAALDFWPTGSSAVRSPTPGESMQSMSGRQSPLPVGFDTSVVAGRLPMLVDPKCRPPPGPPPTPPPPLQPSHYDEYFMASRRSSEEPTHEHPLGSGNCGAEGSVGQEAHGWKERCQQLELELGEKVIALDRANRTAREMQESVEVLSPPPQPSSRREPERWELSVDMSPPRPHSRLDHTWLDSADSDEQQDEDQTHSSKDFRPLPSQQAHDRPPTPEPTHAETEAVESPAVAFPEHEVKLSTSMPAGAASAPLTPVPSSRALHMSGVRDFRPRFGDALPLDDMQWFMRHQH